MIKVKCPVCSTTGTTNYFRTPAGLGGYVKCPCCGHIFEPVFFEDGKKCVWDE